MRSYFLTCKVVVLGIITALATSCALDESSTEASSGETDEQRVEEELGTAEQAATLAGADCGDFMSDLTWSDYSYVGKGSWIWKKWRINNCGSNNWLNYWVKKYYGGLPGSSFQIKNNYPTGAGTICQCIQIPSTLANGTYGLYNRIWNSAQTATVQENGTTVDFVFWALVNVDGRAPVTQCNPNSLPSCP